MDSPELSPLDKIRLPEPVDNSGEIDPNALIVQDGENAGNIDDIEHGEGFINVVGEPSKSHETVDGLPLIGANAEQDSRKQLKNGSPEDNEFINTLLQQQVERGDFPNLKEAAEKMHDERGTDAMAAEVKRRAMAKVPYASEELRNAVGSQAEKNFRDEFESHKAENQARYDAEAQELLDKLRSGTPVSEILQETRIDSVEA